MGFYIAIFSVGYGASELLVLLLADWPWSLGLSLTLLAGVGLVSWFWGGDSRDNRAWEVFAVGVAVNLELLVVHFFGWLLAIGCSIGFVALLFGVGILFGARKTNKPPELESVPKWYRPSTPEAAAKVKAALARWKEKRTK
ncbi:membrane hypothetical protein [Rhodospirillaceae bacterium LM-1]|nr:membrane hypothetical protein [Rhodospirillaceae bacterium LM-1]